MTIEIEEEDDGYRWDLYNEAGELLASSITYGDFEECKASIYTAIELMVDADVADLTGEGGVVQL